VLLKNRHILYVAVYSGQVMLLVLNSVMTEKYNLDLVCLKENISELEKRNKKLSRSPMVPFKEKKICLHDSMTNILVRMKVVKMERQFRFNLNFLTM
jgi:hypothetical protein